MSAPWHLLVKEMQIICLGNNLVTEATKLGTGASGGPVEVLASLMPVMSVTVGFVSLFAERLWNALPESPYFNSGTALLTTAGLILMGGLLAFLMVWTEFTVIAYTSALTFMVAGTFKEIVTGYILIIAFARHD
jgi:hypothetical protein